MESPVVSDIQIMEECHGTIENLKLIANRLEEDVKDLERAVMSFPSAHEMLQQAKSILSPSSSMVEEKKENGITSPITPNRTRYAVPNFTPKYNQTFLIF